MARFTESELRAKARIDRVRKSETSAAILSESKHASPENFDVFLSHSILDAELVHGAKRALEDYGLTVYVDWIDDPQLDRTQVTAATANRLRSQMRRARMLVYAHTENSALSKWCPWELGYFDGMKGGNVFLLPIAASDSSSYKGQEYIGLYPYLDHVNAVIWVNGSADGLQLLREARTKVIAAR